MKTMKHGFREIINRVLAMVVALALFTGVLIPMVNNTNTSGWTATQITIFGVVSIVIIISLVYLAASFLM